MTCAVLFSIVIGTFRHAVSLVTVKQWMTDHVLALNAIDIIHVTATAVELELYKYGTTGVENHLKWAGDILRSARLPYSDLAESITDSPDQLKDFAFVRSEIENTVQKNYQICLAEKAELGAEAARARLLDRLDRGHDRISQVCVKMRRLEMQRLWDRSIQFQENLAKVDIAAISALLLLLLAVLLFVTRRHLAERKRSEEAIRASERRIRSIIENMFDALIIVNDQGTIESTNPRADQMFGYPTGQLVGKSFAALFPENVHISFDTIFDPVQAQSPMPVREFEAQKSTEAAFPIELAIRHYQTEEGHRFLATIRDVSDRHEVEKLKREFVSMVSHELRTPLTSMRLSLGLLSSGSVEGLPEKAVRLGEIMERNAARLMTLVNDLLDIEKMQSGQMEMHLNTVELSAVFDLALESVRALADKNEITIEACPTDRTVFADSDRLVQVLVNFLSNAVKFSPPKGVVTITVGERPGWVDVSVTDRGRGIPAHAQELDFERFSQVEAGDAKKKGGSGLGLTICKAIIQRHDGFIGVDSEQGKGSTFWFRLPDQDGRSDAGDG